METIAHIYYDEETKEWIKQPYEEHQNGVAALAKEFGAQFGCADMGYVMGLLHDEGKKQKKLSKVSVQSKWLHAKSSS